jgi:cytoskeletal protein CcmA (bactofilin family)
MFGQKSKDTASSNFSSPSRSTESSQIKTLISEGCRFEGNLFSPSNTRIDGYVTGNLSGENGLIIGEKGNIVGDVSAIEAVIYGTVRGNIKAHKLEIKGTGKILGDVVVDHIVMEYGSHFNGNLKMNEPKEDLSKAAFDLPEEKKE